MRKIIVLALFLCYSQLHAQLTVEEALSSPFPSDLTASQDKAAWVFNDEGVRNIWMVNAATMDAQKVTNFSSDDGQAISDLIFNAPAGSIIFVRGGAPNTKGETPNPTSDPDGAKRVIFQIAESGGMLDTLSEGSSPTLSPDNSTIAFIKKGQVWFYDFEDKKAKEAFTIRGSAGNLTWSPDSKHLAFRSARGDHSYIGVYDLQENTLQYLSPSVDHDFAPVWAPEGDKLAFIREPNEGSLLPFMPRRNAQPWSIIVHDLKTNTSNKIWEATKGAGSAFRNISANNQLFWTEDDHIIFPYEGNGFTNLWGISAAGGKAKNLTPGNFEVQFVSLGGDNQSILYSSNHNDIDRQHLWMVKPEDNKPTQLTSSGVQWSPVQLRNGTIVHLASSATKPAHVAYLEGKKPQVLAEKYSFGDYPVNELVEPEQVIFSAADGMSIHGQLFKPKNMKAGVKYPAILFFHGGSRRQMLLGFHHRGYYHNAYALNQYLASKGYLVLSVNYRSGIGYGMEFREALNYGARGASEFNDVMGAGLYLKNRSDVDGNKIGLWGGSYGGYLTALGLAKASDLFAAGVDIHGVHDWNVVIKNFVPSYNATAKAEVAKLALDSSPMAFIDGWRSPVLLIHGDDDRNVPFSETVDLVEQLRNQEVYFEQLVFPDEVHGFLLHQNWVDAYKATADFFDRMLKDKRMGTR